MFVDVCFPCCPCTAAGFVAVLVPQSSTLRVLHYGRRVTTPITTNPHTPATSTARTLPATTTAFSSAGKEPNDRPRHLTSREGQHEHIRTPRHATTQSKISELQHKKHLLGHTRTRTRTRTANGRSVGAWSRPGLGLGWRCRTTCAVVRHCSQKTATVRTHHATQSRQDTEKPSKRMGMR